MTEELLVEALAVARLTRLVRVDRVPFGKARARLLANVPDDALLAELFDCDWCMSVWIALATVLVLRHLPGWRLLARVLAASYVTGFLAER